MYVQVSKVFADFINKTAKELSFEAHAEVVDMTFNQYRLSVGDPFDADTADYKGDGFKAIMITYPAEYYACPQYLSTKTLKAEFHRRKVENFDGLKKMIRDMVEI